MKQIVAIRVDWDFLLAILIFAQNVVYSLRVCDSLFDGVLVVAAKGTLYLCLSTTLALDNVSELASIRALKMNHHVTELVPAYDSVVALVVLLEQLCNILVGGLPVAKVDHHILELLLIQRTVVIPVVVLKGLDEPTLLHWCQVFLVLGLKDKLNSAILTLFLFFFLQWFHLYLFWIFFYYIPGLKYIIK